MFEIVRYEPGMSRRWNEMVASSRNATFLFDRGYMDYHSDRFADCSWMAFKGNRPMALLPANLTPDGVLHSHQGLSYGGWILPPAHLDGEDVLEIFNSAVEAWKSEGIKALDYKTLPYIYAARPSQEDEYALFRLGASLSERNLSATIDLHARGPFNKLRRRHLEKTLQLPIRVEETDDIDAFMLMLADCLRERHDTSPVHTAREMKFLKEAFPDKIRFFITRYEGEPHAGVCVYDTGIVAHAQYIATTPEGRRLNLLTPLFVRLLDEVFASRRYFDFGISNEDHGRILNPGLLRQKYSFGATGTVTNRYFLEL